MKPTACCATSESPARNGDVVLDVIKYEPVKVGSNLYHDERTAKRLPVYVENICVRNVRLEAVGNKTCSSMKDMV